MRVPTVINPRTRVNDTPAAYAQGRAADVGGLVRPLAELGQAVRDDELRREEFDVSSAVIAEADDLEKDFQRRKEEAPLGADGFTDQLGAAYGLRHEEILKGFEERGYSREAVDTLALRLQNLRARVGSEALTFQGQSYRAKVDQTLDTNNLKLQQLAQARPNDLEGIIAESDENIDMIPHLTAEEKVDRKTRAQQVIRTAAAIGLVNSDPDLVKRLLQPSETTVIPGTPGTSIDYSKASFADVKDLIGDKEGPASLGGYNAIAYNTSASANAAGVPQKNLTGMTLGQVQDFQKNVMRPLTRGRRSPGDVGSTGVGRYQFESRTLAENAEKTFGAGWRDVVFSPENQDRIAATLFDRVKGNPALLKNTWAHFSGQIGRDGTPTRTETRSLPLAASGETGNVVLDALDPQQRQNLLNVADRMIDEREREAAIAQRQVYDQRLNGLLNSLNDGTLGQEGIEAARKEGWLTDYDDINKAEGVLASKQKENSDLDTFNLLMGTNGFQWNQLDKDQQDAVDAGVEAMGNTPQAAFSVWEKTGILAKPMQTALRGGLLSTNPQTVGQVANIAGNMVRARPNAFTGMENASEVEASALAYNHYIYDLGLSPTEAANRIAQENTPEYKAKVRVAQPQMDAIRDMFHKEGTGLEASDFGGDAFVSPATKQRIDASYAELVISNLQRGRDQDTAEAMAKAQLKKVFGRSVDGRVMQYPPEAIYPRIGGSHQYIYDDAAATVKEEAGVDVVPGTLRFIPIPGVTDQDFRTGKPPRYRLMYGQNVNGQVIFDTVPGQWQADVSGPVAQRNAENAQNFAAERARLPAPSLAQIKARNPKRAGESGFEYQQRLNSLRLQAVSARDAAAAQAPYVEEKLTPAQRERRDARPDLGGAF